jgi:NADH:ubiquinone oxidoreductase subunit C
LESGPFGRSGMVSIWVETHLILRVAEVLKNDEELKIDSLENLSIVELEKALVATYFVNSTVTRHKLVIRTSAVPKSDKDKVDFLSVRSVWPMVEPLEKELGELFGVNFKIENEEPQAEGVKEEEISFLPEGWEGFPLRKSYIFPKSYSGIAHSRTISSSSTKKHHDE